jgi:peptidoglycan/xylan/chitin deacetylase (PgdA/CDA1 family)
MTAFWTLTVLVVGVLALGGFYVYAWSEPTWQVFGPALVRGPATGGRVALTFDDGPASPFTEQILDILQSRNVKATFFVCGRNVERFPEILKRIHAEGHLVGNHAYSHKFPYFRRRAFFREEIDRTQEAIEKVIGQRPTVFRPPFGARWLGLYDVLNERGLRLVAWSDTGYDWDYEADEIVRRTLEKLGPGSIILLHDGKRADPLARFDRSSTVRALPAILDGVQKAGLTFVPLSEFLL